MHPRNNGIQVFALVLLMAVALLAQTQQPSGQTQPAQQTPAQQPPANPQDVPTGDPEAPAPAQAPNQPGNTVQVPSQPGQQQGQAAERTEGGGFVFRKQVEEVTLHATVLDDKKRMVTTLDRGAFKVYEDGQAQQITSFRREDIPVSLGIIIDNSGSMREKRPAVNQAAVNLVQASNPQDEVFVVNYNDEYYLDQDFTSEVPLLKEALARIESRGGTALYDAVVASADHLKKHSNPKLQKKVLLVVTDGEDNASQQTLEQAVRRLQEEDGPTVYTIGILEEGGRKAKRAKRALAAMAEQTGGVSFFPRDVSEVDAISRAVAHDIRNQYTIGYKPSNPQGKGGYRQVRVEAQAPGYKRLEVRTRSGYYAGELGNRAAR